MVAGQYACSSCGSSKPCVTFWRTEPIVASKLGAPSKEKKAVKSRFAPLKSSLVTTALAGFGGVGAAWEAGGRGGAEGAALVAL